MILDRDNLAQFPAQLQLTGKMVDGAIAGSVDMVVGFSNYAELDAETFSASRTSAQYWQPKPPAPIAPVDLTGVWKRSIILGPIGRTNPHLNKAGLARQRSFRKVPTILCCAACPQDRCAGKPGVEIWKFWPQPID